MKLVLKLPEFKGAKQRYKESIITRVIDSGVLNLDRNISFDISDIKNKDMIFLFGKKEWEKIKTGAWASVAVDKDRNIFTDTSLLYNKYLIHGLRKSVIFQSFLKKGDKK